MCTVVQPSIVCKQSQCVPFLGIRSTPRLVLSPDSIEARIWVQARHWVLGWVLPDRVPAAQELLLCCSGPLPADQRGREDASESSECYCCVSRQSLGCCWLCSPTPGPVTGLQRRRLIPAPLPDAAALGRKPSLPGQWVDLPPPLAGSLKEPFEIKVYEIDDVERLQRHRLPLREDEAKVREAPEPWGGGRAVGRALWAPGDVAR